MVVLLSAANVHDSRMLVPVLNGFKGLRRRDKMGNVKRGRPKKRFGKLHADKGYDYVRCRNAVKKRGMKDRIARRGIESNEKLGKHRWKVERTMSWFNGFRKLRVRDDRSSKSFLAFHQLAAILMCFRCLQAAS